MDRCYKVIFWAENEFGEFETYGTVFGGFVIKDASAIAESYRQAGHHTRVDVIYYPLER